MKRPVELAEIFSTATVGLIPYVLNAYTRGVSPLKTFEYGAAGLSVVATDLPGVTPVEGMVWVAPDRTRFIDAVAQADASMGAANIADRIQLAATHSWERRGDQVRELVALSLRFVRQAQ